MLNAKNSFLMIAFSLLLIGTVSSLEVKKTEFIVTTDPYQNLSIAVKNADTNELLQEFSGRARKFGEFRFTYYGTIDSVNLEASIVNNDTGETIKEEDFGPYSLGTATINLNLSSDEVVEEIESDESTEVSNESASENSPILGFATGEIGNLSKVYYYIAAAVFGVIVIIIVLKKHLSMVKSGPVEPNPKKVLKSKSEKPSKTELSIQSVPQKSNESSIDDTEKRIADLQKQLEQVRNEEKLVKMQKQLAMEQKELKRLQTEDEPVQQPQNSLNQDNNQNKF